MITLYLFEIFTVLLYKAMELDHVATPCNELLQPLQRFSFCHFDLVPFGRVELTQRHVLVEEVVLAVFRETLVDLLVLDSYQT